MPFEKRTRVEIFLPIRTDSADYRTITEVRSLLMDALNEQEVWVVYHPVTRVTAH